MVLGGFWLRFGWFGDDGSCESVRNIRVYRTMYRMKFFGFLSWGVDRTDRRFPVAWVHFQNVNAPPLIEKPYKSRLLAVFVHFTTKTFCIVSSDFALHLNYARRTNVYFLRFHNVKLSSGLHRKCCKYNKIQKDKHDKIFCLFRQKRQLAIIIQTL